MDTALIIVTGLSLLTAGISAAFAWRVVRAERQRTAARVAALAAAARAAQATDQPTAEIGHAAIALDTTTSTFSNVPGGLQEFVPVDQASVEGTAARGGQELGGDTVSTGAIFTRPAVDSGSGGRQRGLLVAASAFGAIVLVTATALFVSGRGPGTEPAAASAPLELVTLGHARTTDGFSITGVVRNPANGSVVERLEAVARVFDAAGIMIATKTTPVDVTQLAAGQETPFVVALGEATTAARYRVSFSAAGQMLAHVDRRTNLPAAVTADAR